MTRTIINKIKLHYNGSPYTQEKQERNVKMIEINGGKRI